MRRKRKPESKQKTLRGKGYPTEFKLKVAPLVVDRGRSVYEVAKAIGLAHTTVKEWALRYEARGALGLERGRATPSVEDEQPRPKDPVREAVEQMKAAQPEPDAADQGLARALRAKCSMDCLFAKRTESHSPSNTTFDASSTRQDHWCRQWRGRTQAA
jgi:transposase-like protein